MNDPARRPEQLDRTALLFDNADERGIFRLSEEERGLLDEHRTCIF